MNCIEIKNVTKEFKNTRALDNINLKFEENKIYGLLGRNGAGKSTLLKIISNRIFTDSGSITVNGKTTCENDSSQRKIYLMNESNLYPPKMKIKKAFQVTASFYPDFDFEYANKLAKLFNLNVNKQIRSLSTGYTSIFKVITALSVNTPYVFMDEPILGLDANHRELFYKCLLEKYTDNPFCCIISTHIIEEVAGIIENVVIIKNGSIIRDTSCEELLSEGYTISGPVALADKLAEGKNIIGSDSIGGLKNIYIAGKNDITEIPVGIEIVSMDLQKLFVQLTNS